MKYWRVFVGIIILGGVIEFLTPILSAKTGVLVPLIQSNCGAVPVFIQDVMRVQSNPDLRYWRGFITCGGSVLGFILMPGFLKIILWIYHFVHPRSSNPVPE